jgi:hypothetical protein
MLLFEVETIAAPVWVGAVDAPPPPPYPPYPFPPAFAPPVVAPALVVPELDPPELELLLPHPAASAPTAASATSPSSGRRANPNLVGRESPVGRVASVRCSNALMSNHLLTTFPFLHGADPVPRSDRSLWPPAPARRARSGPVRPSPTSVRPPDRGPPRIGPYPQQQNQLRGAPIPGGPACGLRPDPWRRSPPVRALHDRHCTDTPANRESAGTLPARLRQGSRREAGRLSQVRKADCQAESDPDTLTPLMPGRSTL